MQDQNLDNISRLTNYLKQFMSFEKYVSITRRTRLYLLKNRGRYSYIRESDKDLRKANRILETHRNSGTDFSD